MGSRFALRSSTPDEPDLASAGSLGLRDSPARRWSKVVVGLLGPWPGPVARPVGRAA